MAPEVKDHIWALQQISDSSEAIQPLMSRDLKNSER